MAKAQSIAPFPADIDRDAFGHWLSGFVDGEGCFRLAFVEQVNKGRPTPDAVFSILLRADDLPILQLIQSYFGTCRIYSTRYSKNPNANPAFKLTTTNISDTSNAIVPHFERYPLRAKKARDFEIWKRGVAFISSIVTRPKTGGTWQRGGRRWSDAELEHFTALCVALKAQREFKAPVIPLPLPTDDSMPLFAD
jgi:hypothetical protein